MSVNPKFDDAIARMKLVHDFKNSDYSKGGNPYSNFEHVADITGCDVNTVFLIHAANKIARLGALLSSKKTPANESIEDSILDLAVYSTIWLSYYRNDGEDNDK